MKVFSIETNKNKIYETFAGDILYELNAFHINELIKYTTKLKKY